jgi:hypothetical protein
MRPIKFTEYPGTSRYQREETPYRQPSPYTFWRQQRYSQQPLASGGADGPRLGSY